MAFGLYLINRKIYRTECNILGDNKGRDIIKYILTWVIVRILSNREKGLEAVKTRRLIFDISHGKEFQGTFVMCYSWILLSFPTKLKVVTCWV